MSVKDLYVMAVAITPDGTAAAGLTKLKGPSFLRGKLTFPGGRIEAHEDARTAAARELFEETGIHVEASAMVHVDKVVRDDAEMDVFVVVTPQARYARTQEIEPVSVLELAFHRRQAAIQPDVYAPDFLLRVGQAEKVCLASRPRQLAA